MYNLMQALSTVTSNLPIYYGQSMPSTHSCIWEYTSMYLYQKFNNYDVNNGEIIKTKLSPSTGQKFTVFISCLMQGTLVVLTSAVYRGV